MALVQELQKSSLSLDLSTKTVCLTEALASLVGRESQERQDFLSEKIDSFLSTVLSQNHGKPQGANKHGTLEKDLEEFKQDQQKNPLSNSESEIRAIQKEVLHEFK